MATSGQPIAELFAVLGLDSTVFNRELDAAKAKIIKAAAEMKIPVKQLAETLDELGDLPATSKLVQQFEALKAKGLETHQALAAVSAASARERVMIENAATTAQLAAFKQMEAGYIAAEAREVEAAKAASAARKAIAAQEASERAMLTQGAYAGGGYVAGHTARLLGGVGGTAAIGGAAIAFGAYELLSITKESSEAALATRNLAEELGLTFEQTRRLQEEAQIAGVNINTLQQASWHLAQALDGSSAQGRQLANKLQEIGLQGKTSGELLLNFLKYLAQIPDQTQRIALAHEVMGRASYQIIPLISNYKELQTLVGNLDNELNGKGRDALLANAQAINKMDVEWNRFKQDAAVTVGIPIEKWVIGWGEALMKYGKILASPDYAIFKFLASLRMTSEGLFPKSDLAPPPIPNAVPGAFDVLGLEAARASKKNMPASLADLRADLSEAQREQESARRNLTRTVAPLGMFSPERAAEQKKYDDAKALAAKLQEEIKVLEDETDEKRYQRAIRASEQSEALAKKDIQLEYDKTNTAEKLESMSIDEISAAQTDLNHKLRDATIAGLQERANLASRFRSGEDKQRYVDAIAIAEKDAAIKDVEIFNKTQRDKLNYADEYRAALQAIKDKDARAEEARLKHEEEQQLEIYNNRLRAALTSVKVNADAQDKMLADERQHDKFLESQGIITQDQRIARDRETDRAVLDNRQTALDLSLALIQQFEGRAGAEYTRTATEQIKAEAQVDKAREANAKRAQGYSEEIAKGTDSIAQATNAEIVKQRELQNLRAPSERLVELENLRLKTWAITQQTQGMAIAYKDFLNIAVSGFRSLNSNMAQAIIGAKSFHDAWQSTVKSVGAAIVDFILTNIEKIAGAWIVQQLGIRAASKIVAVQQVMDAAAIAGANAYAATAAIPIFGPALAPAAGLLADAQVLSTYIPMVVGGFDLGGMVPADSAYMLHADEYVINRPLTHALTDLANGGGMGGGDHFDFRGSQFGQGVTQGSIDLMFQTAVGKIRRAGGLGIKPGRL